MDYALAQPKEEGKPYNVHNGQETNNNPASKSEWFEFNYDSEEFKALVYTDKDHHSLANIKIVRPYYRIIADFKLAFESMKKDEQAIFIAAVLKQVYDNDAHSGI